jgi:hypothetical protein
MIPLYYQVLMTPKRVLFAEHYALDHNGAAAAVRAGYAKPSARQIASELLANPDVQELIAKYEEEAAERLGMTKERVVEGLQFALEMARQQGNPVAMVAALRQIGTLIGAYREERTKIEVNINGHALRLKFAAMSDAELMDVIEEPEIEP